MRTSDSIRRAYDVVVVGARCGGAATAMLLARQGARVLVLERAAYGSDTLSTLALMRGGVLQLARWGLLDHVVAAGTPPVRRTTFHYDADAVVVDIAPRDGVDALYAPRRTVLDRILADGAAEAGCTLLFGTRLVDLVRRDDGRVVGACFTDSQGGSHAVDADIVVGADGTKSTVARLVGAEITHRGRHAGGVVYGYWRDLPVDGYHWHYNPGVSTGVIPTNDDETLVFAAGPSSRFRHGRRAATAEGYHEVLSASAPALAERLEAATLSGTLHGFVGEPGFLRKSVGPGWALVGDAGYFKDPITAHGITDALRDAELLARAIVDGSVEALDAYEQRRNELAMDLFDATDQIASYAWDMPTAQALHRRTSQAMKAEVALIAALGDWPRSHDATNTRPGVEGWSSFHRVAREAS